MTRDATIGVRAGEGADASGERSSGGNAPDSE